MHDISDIFKSYDIRGKVGSQLNEQTVEQIARVFANWLPVKGIVAVGRDMRPDSNKLANAFIKGLTEQGFNVWDIGEVTSDMIYFAIGKWDLAGGAVITASHNPGNDNGIKLYRDKVTAVGLDAGLREIRNKFLAEDLGSPAATPGIVTTKSITEDWVQHCLSFIRELKPYDIAIDAGNGMAGAILPSILPKLPLTVKEMYFEPDGTFPNHDANPHNVENLADLIKTVNDGHLDFGIAFDGDGDRAVFVDDFGRPVASSDMITIIARMYLQKYPGAKIVHDVRTSMSTQELIREWGGEPVRTKVGRVYIGTLMRQVGAPFGGECSGHLFFKDNYDADSGLIGALVGMQAISDSGKKLSELVDKYQRYITMPETNIEITEGSSRIFERLKKEFSGQKQDNLDGLTVWLDGSWFNIRASNTEPVIRLNAEAKSKKQLDALVERLMKNVSG